MMTPEEHSNAIETEWRRNASERLDLDRIERQAKSEADHTATGLVRAGDVVALVAEVRRLRAEADVAVETRAVLAQDVVDAEADRDRLADAIRTHRKVTRDRDYLHDRGIHRGTPAQAVNETLWSALDQDTR